jgi:hypothetical protein
MGVSQIANAGFSRLFQGLKPPKSFMCPVHPRLKPGTTDRSNPNQSNKISYLYRQPSTVAQTPDQGYPKREAAFSDSL